MGEPSSHSIPNQAKAALNTVHKILVSDRRTRVLAACLDEMIPAGGRLLDLGCGDGTIAMLLSRRRPDLQISGADVLVRPNARIPVTQIEGERLPFEDGEFDVVSLVDVLHHTDDPAAVLSEAKRVARRMVVVKDHLREGWLARPTLRLMDWVGNRGHDVRLPYNYLNEEEWGLVLSQARMKIAAWRENLALYPAPASWVFDRRLHFVARFEPA